jgi:hypothetical protein
MASLCFCVAAWPETTSEIQGAVTDENGTPLQVQQLLLFTFHPERNTQQPPGRMEGTTWPMFVLVVLIPSLFHLLDLKKEKKITSIFCWDKNTSQISN